MPLDADAIAAQGSEARASAMAVICGWDLAATESGLKTWSAAEQLACEVVILKIRALLVFSAVVPAVTPVT